MSLYLPVMGLNRSQKVRIGKGATAQMLAFNTVSYVDITDGNVKRDIQRHSAIGALLVVGPLTANNSDPVVTNGAAASAANLVITVTAGDLRNRTTGVVTPVAGGTVTLAAADGTQDRTDLVWIKASDGTLGWSKGVLAAAGTAVGPAAGSGTVTSIAGSSVNANNVITVASTAGIAVGQAITGTGIPNNNWVTAITSGTTFTIAYNATATASHTYTLINTIGDSTWLVAATLTAATLVADVRPRS